MNKLQMYRMGCETSHGFNKKSFSLLKVQSALLSNHLNKSKLINQSKLSFVVIAAFCSCHESQIESTGINKHKLLCCSGSP